MAGQSGLYQETYLLVFCVCVAGESGWCQEKYPQVLYADSGRSEFYRIRLHLPQLIVDLNDPTFAVSFSVPIR